MVHQRRGATVENERVKQQLGEAPEVAPIDKLSVVVVVAARSPGLFKLLRR